MNRIPLSINTFTQKTQFETLLKQQKARRWIAEATCFLANCVHVDCALAVFDDVASGILQIWDVPTSSARQVQALMRRYRRMPMDLADATLGIQTYIASDRDGFV